MEKTVTLPLSEYNELITDKSYLIETIKNLKQYDKSFRDDEKIYLKTIQEQREEIDKLINVLSEFTIAKNQKQSFIEKIKYLFR